MGIGVLALAFGALCLVVIWLGRNYDNDKKVRSADYSDVYLKLAIKEL